MKKILFIVSAFILSTSAYAGPFSSSGDLDFLKMISEKDLTVERQLGLVVTFDLEGEVISVSKLNLMKKSEFYRQMFSVKMSEEQTGVIQPKSEESVFVKVLRVLEVGEVDPFDPTLENYTQKTGELIDELLRIELVQPLHLLVQKVIDSIILNEDTIESIVDLADQYESRLNELYQVSLIDRILFYFQDKGGVEAIVKSCPNYWKTIGAEFPTLCRILLTSPRKIQAFSLKPLAPKYDTSPSSKISSENDFMTDLIKVVEQVMEVGGNEKTIAHLDLGAAYISYDKLHDDSGKFRAWALNGYNKALQKLREFYCWEYLSVKLPSATRNFIIFSKKSCPTGELNQYKDALLEKVTREILEVK